jgi:hypothetical protein
VCAGRVESQGLQPEGIVERLLSHGSAQSRRIQYLEVLKGCRKECVQESS